VRTREGEGGPRGGLGLRKKTGGGKEKGKEKGEKGKEKKEKKKGNRKKGKSGKRNIKGI
jgi:hypothetical protein